MQLRRRTILAAVGASTAVAGCLADDDDSDGPAPEDDDDEPNDESGESDDESAETDEQSDATVQVRSHPEFGDILVGPDEMTLYNFDSDERGELESTCDDDCAETWPPLTAEEEPIAGDDVAAELTTFEREDGSMQVVANGWPLYYFAADEEPGDAEGQGVNDVWWVLDTDGTPIRPEEDPEEDEDTEDDDGGGY